MSRSAMSDYARRSSLCFMQSHTRHHDKYLKGRHLWTYNYLFMQKRSVGRIFLRRRVLYSLPEPGHWRSAVAGLCCNISILPSFESNWENLSRQRSKDIKTMANGSGKLEVLLTNATGAIGFSSNGRRLASSSYDKAMRLWDVDTGAHQQTLKGHYDAVLSVTFSLDGRWLASASDDRTVRLWNTETGILQQTLEGAL